MLPVVVFKEQGPRCYAIGFLIKVRDVMQLKQSTMSCYLSFSIVQKVRHEIFLSHNLIKSRSLSMVKVDKEKPKERDHDGTRNSYNTSVQFGNR